jgi:hypothetical protein
MNCPNDTNLALWLEGRLDPAAAEAIRTHLEACLECRLVVGPDLRNSPFHASTEVTAGDGPLFSRFREKLRDAFHGAEALRRDDFDDEESDEDVPIILAADSARESSAESIPSYVGEAGQLVVTFRPDASTGVVTAHLVSQDPARVAFRALTVGDCMFVSDRSGKALLTGIRPEDLLGMRIVIPPTVGEGSLDPATVLSDGVPRQCILQASGTQPHLAALTVRLATPPAGPELRLTSEQPPIEHFGLVLILDESTARYAALDDEATAVFPWTGELPHKLRIVTVALC